MTQANDYILHSTAPGFP